MKKIYSLIIFAALGILSFSENTLAQTFSATFTFDSVKTTSGSVDPTPLPVVTGIAFDSVRAFGVSANSSATQRFSFTSWPLGATANNNSYASLTGAVDPGKYFQIKLSANSGYQFTVDTVTFRVQRSGTGVRTYVVTGNADMFGANLNSIIEPANANLSVQSGNVFFWNFDSITTGQNGSLLLPGTGYQSIDSSVVFRFYAYNAEGTAGTFSIDNVTIKGSVSVAISTGKEFSFKAPKLYPNPANSSVMIDFGSFENTNVAIYNVLGEQMINKNFGSLNRTRIDLSNLAEGSYFVKISDEKNTITKKLSLQK